MKRHQQEQAIYHDEEINFHEAAIKRHVEAIERHKLLRTQSEAKIRENEEMEKQRIMEENKHWIGFDFVIEAMWENLI